MIRLKQSYNELLIKELVRSEDIRPYILDDQGGESLVLNPNTLISEWLIVYQDGFPVGYFMLHAITSTCLGVHFGFLRKFKRDNWEETLGLFFDYVKRKHPRRKLLGVIPSSNERSRKRAELAGFKQEGHVSKFFSRNGKSEDVYFYGYDIGD